MALLPAVEEGYAAAVAATRVPAGRPTRRRQGPSCRRCCRCCLRSWPSVAAGAMIDSFRHERRRARNGAYDGGGEERGAKHDRRKHSCGSYRCGGRDRGARREHGISITYTGVRFPPPTDGRMGGQCDSGGSVCEPRRPGERERKGHRGRERRRNHGSNDTGRRGSEAHRKCEESCCCDHVRDRDAQGAAGGPSTRFQKRPQSWNGRSPLLKNTSGGKMVTSTLAASPLSLTSAEIGESYGLVLVMAPFSSQPPSRIYAPLGSGSCLPIHRSLPGSTPFRRSNRRIHGPSSAPNPPGPPPRVVPARSFRV